MPVGMERYGLTQNPFRMTRELNPLFYSEDKDLLIQVDGFSKLEEIDNCIREAVEHQQAAFALVVGRSGTGRTTIANYILSRYAHYREISPERFIVPSRDRKVLDKLTTFKRWLIQLEIELNRKKFSLPPELKADLRNHLRNAELTTMELYFQDLTSRIDEFLSIKRDAPSGFGCCLENVPDIEIIDAAMQIFDQVQTACVFTVWENDTHLEKVIKPFAERPRRKNERIVELSTLTGADVNLLIENRWKLFTQTQNPFDPRGVEAAFKDRSRPVGRVLSLVADLLEVKLAQNSSGPAWPEADELGFSEFEIGKLVTILENRMI